MLNKTDSKSVIHIDPEIQSGTRVIVGEQAIAALEEAKAGLGTTCMHTDTNQE